MSTQHRVTGRLTADAQARMALGGSYIVMVELQQSTPLGVDVPADKALPLVGAYQMGHGACAAIAANSKAAALRKGTLVRIWCAGIGLGYTSEDEAAIRLHGIDHVEVITPPAANPARFTARLTHEPSSALDSEAETQPAPLPEHQP